MRSRCRHIDLSQPLKLIKQQVANTEEAEHINDAIQAEVAGKNRSSVIKYLQTQVRKRQRANRKKGACKDRHKNPSADRHTPTLQRKQDRHKNPSADRHKNPSADRHKNPSADRHKRAVDPNRGGTMRDFFWDHRECSAMHCAANFAMEAASSKH